MLPTRDLRQNKRPEHIESEELETNIPSKQTGKKAEVAIQISDRIDFKRRAIKKDPEGHFIIQRTNPPRRHKHCKYICTQYRCTKIHKENLGGLQKNIDSNTIIVGDFNTARSKRDRFFKQNINKDIVSLNNTLEEMDLTDI